MNAVRLTGYLIFVSAFTFAPAAPAAALFEKGDETFTVRDSKGQTPTFRVLDKTAAGKALALALLTTLRYPATEYVDLKIQEFYFSPVKGKNEIYLSVKLNDRYVEIPKTVSREKFLSGQWIDMSFPVKEKDLAVFELNADGQLKMRLHPTKNEIEIQNAKGHMVYTSPLLGEGEETVKFTGIATRKL